MDENQNSVQNAIRSAIISGDEDRVFALILEDQTRLQIMTVFGTWLHVAASAGKLQIVRRLVDLGAEVNVQGGIKGGNALNSAASRGHVDVVKYLLSRGAQMDVREPVWNPLFSSIIGGHTEVAKVLIDSGIDTSVKYSGDVMHNMDALGFAIQWGRSDIVKLLSRNSSSSQTETLDEAESVPVENLTERPLTSMDLQMLDEAQVACREMLGLSADATSTEMQDRINSYLAETFIKDGSNDHGHPERPLGDDTALALGALWGTVVCESCGWEWIVVTRDESDGIGVSDPERKYLVLPLLMFESLFESDSETRDITYPGTLFNCISSGNLPESEPKMYGDLSGS